MRYDERDEESRNVEDRRGQSGGGMFRIPGFPGPGGGRQVRIPFPMGGGGRRGGGIGIFGLLIIGGIMLLLGINPLELLFGGRGGGSGLPDFSQVPQIPNFERQAQQPGQPLELPGGQGRTSAPDDQLASFTKKVLRDTEIVWSKLFQRAGRTYEPPTMVLFRGATQTRCGQGVAQMGPFYCPLDRKIYLDLSFFDELHRKFRAPGDFAQAYVIAHEVGHHIQTQLGIAAKVQQMKQSYPSAANQIQVRMELQADCLSGVWASQLKNRLEPGDIEEEPQIVPGEIHFSFLQCAFRLQS